MIDLTPPPQPENTSPADAPKKTTAWITWLIITINTAIALYFLIKKINLDKMTVLDAVNTPMNIALLSLTDQAWRLISSMFVHANLLHFAMNMIFLMMIGHIFERAAGQIRFIIIYIAGGTLASLTSAHYSIIKTIQYFNATSLPSMILSPSSGLPISMPSKVDIPSLVSTGASGAIMALTGAYLMYLLRMPANTVAQQETRKSGLSSILVPNIDQAAHLGGLISGFILAGCLYTSTKTPWKTSQILTTIITTTITACLIYSATTYYRNHDTVRTIRQEIFDHDVPQQEQAEEYRT
jgi:rhomboid protease GluP